MNKRIHGFRLLVFGGVLAVLGVSLARADVSLPAIFGSHMVVQQGIPFVVWGWADPGEAVSIEFCGSTAATKAGADGSWRVSLPAPTVTRGEQLTVRGNTTLVFENVAVGEVWLASGQSNMEMGVSICDNAEQEIASANYPDIRLIDVPKVCAAAPQKNFTGKWVPCSPETIASHGTWGGFSAAAYYFGRELYRALDVPVGLIDSSWGGSRIEPWTPPVGFQGVPSLADVARRLENADPHSQAYATVSGQFLQAMTDWLSEGEKALDGQVLPPSQPKYPDSLTPLDRYGDPASMYNAMIHPLVPFGTRGVIWYQGESNHWDGMRYVDKTRAQVQGWRTLWSNPVLPYYYVQIAPYQYGEEPPDKLAVFWEAQAAIEKEIPHTGMAVIHDVGNVKDIHPKNKQEVGRRLALLALAETYGKENTICRGPIFREMTIEGDHVRIHFDHADGGLRTRDGKAPDWFEILGENTVFLPAQATIDGDCVVLSHPEIHHPCVARYMWNKLAEPNLANSAGLPATAFSHGEIPVRLILDAKVPEAADYQLVYALSLPEITLAGDRVTYDVDRSAEIQGGFDRVAYFLEYRDGGGALSYVFVSMEAFSQNPAEIGVPAFATQVHLQKAVGDLSVVSNVSGLATGTGIAGWIEFWPCNYAPDNEAKVPGASEDKYDFGDHMSMGTPNGYGSMQIHNLDARQVVMAYNNWKAMGSADLGIGNSPSGHPDWTFSKSAGSRQQARLLVLVRPKKAGN